MPNTRRLSDKITDISETGRNTTLLGVCPRYQMQIKAKWAPKRAVHTAPHCLPLEQWVHRELMRDF